MTEGEAPPNAGRLPQILKDLADCTWQQALDYYEGLVGAQYFDDWLFAQLGKEDLFFLLTTILRRPDVSHPWVYARCRELEAAPDEHLDLWAREHYKSTLITFGLTIQDILRDPEITVGIFSHNRPTAKAFLRQIKLEFEANELLKRLYPDVMWSDPQSESPKWSEDEGIVVRRQGNPKEATVEAWGLVDGMPTSKHFRLMVYDDIVTETSCTVTLMAKTTTSLELSYNLGADGGARRFIGTRYHTNDSYRTLLDRKTAKVRLYNGTEDNSGDLKRPVLLSVEAMANKRRDMGPYTFACQILQNPRADATQGFQRAWLEFWTPDDGAGLNIYLLRDAANSKKQHADYTSDWVVGLGPDENFYVLAIYRDRLNLTQRTDLLFELHKRWRPIETRYEEYGMQGDIEHIKGEMNRRKYRFAIKQVGGRLRKEDRIKRLVPIAERHRLILPSSFHVTTAEHETKDMVHEFIEGEYMAFPVPAHDDMLDGLARICDEEAVGGEKLTLKWPAKRKPIKVPKRVLADPGMGY